MRSGIVRYLLLLLMGLVLVSPLNSLARPKVSETPTEPAKTSEALMDVNPESVDGEEKEEVEDPIAEATDRAVSPEPTAPSVPPESAPVTNKKTGSESETIVGSSTGNEEDEKGEAKVQELETTSKQKEAREKIIIEPQDADSEVSQICNCKFSSMTPYRTRRSSWGGTFQLGYSGYQPESYVPDFVINQTYSTYYGANSMKGGEIGFTIKKNFGAGALALDLGIGFFTAAGKDSTTLTLIPGRVGVEYFLDTLFAEPYIVPYGGGGVYSIQYKESTTGQSYGGNTQVSFYYVGGIGIQLDRLDEYGDQNSYTEAGIENTFLFVEGRGFIASGGVKDPALGSSLHVNAGLRFEF